MPAISIVIPTYNRWSQLQSVLKALAHQTVPQREFEVIVVSDGSTDGTDEELEAGRSPIPVVFIRQTNQGPAVARNTAVEQATGDLVLFIDDDVVAEPECVSAHLRAHERAELPTVVIGPLLTPDQDTLEPWVLWEQRMLEKQYRAMARGDWHPTARQFYTGNASLGRQCFIESGGFDPSFRRGEDVELAYRLKDRGLHFAFEFEARAFHHAMRSYNSWLSNATSYGRNDAIMWRDRGQDWLLPTIRAEFRGRNALTRAYTMQCLRFPRFGGWSSRAIETIARRSERFDVIGQPALSAVYSLAYYRGVVEELGGLDAFMAVPTTTERAPLILRWWMDGR